MLGSGFVSPLHLEAAGKRCRNQRGGSLGGDAEAASAERECMKPLDADGFHALVCQVGGLVIRRHHSLRDAFAWIGPSGLRCADRSL